MVAAVVLALSAAACAHAAPSAPASPLADGSDQAITKAVNDITTFPRELDPRIWDGFTMRPEVRDATLRVIDRVLKDAGIEGLAVDRVMLFGSNASYEYDDHADFGVHVFTHASGMTDKQLAGVLRVLNDDVERRQQGHIRLNGIPLELTFHGNQTSQYQPRPGIGQYSISDNAWVQRPTEQPDHFDRAQMTADMRRFINEYNALVTEYLGNKKGFDCARFGGLDRELAAYRDQGFSDGLGSRSTQNLTYRALRRLNVEIPEMVDTLEDECTFVKESVG